MNTQTQTPDLTGKQRRFLRALGHHKDAIVQLGKHGLNDAVETAVDVALTQHELIKIRLGTECPDERGDVASALSEKLSAHLVQILGRTILLYRRHPKEPKIVLPSDKPNKPKKPAAPPKDEPADAD